MSTLNGKDAEARAAEIIPPTAEGTWDWPYLTARRMLAAVLAAEFAAGRDGTNALRIIEGNDPRGIPLGINKGRDAELLEAIENTSAAELANDPRDFVIARVCAARALHERGFRS